MMTEAQFHWCGRSRSQHLVNAQATIVGCMKLIARARDGEEVDDNIRCANAWLRIAADELDGLLKARKD